MTPGLALAIALGALLATPGAPAPAKHSKPTLDMQKVEVPVRQTPAPKPRTEMAPRLTVEQFVSRQRGRLDKLGGQQMGLLRQMLQAASPDDPQLPDLYFRLAELCADRYRYLEHNARSLDEAIFRAEQAEKAASAAPQSGPEEDGAR
jgi:hypothetical protein